MLSFEVLSDQEKILRNFTSKKNDDNKPKCPR